MEGGPVRSVSQVDQWTSACGPLLQHHLALGQVLLPEYRKTQLYFPVCTCMYTDSVWRLVACVRAQRALSRLVLLTQFKTNCKQHACTQS